CQHSIDISARGRSFEFARINRQEIRVVTIAEFPRCRYRLMMARGLFRCVPHRLYCNFKMPERAAPGFNRVRCDPGIPVQFVDREAAVLDGWQNSPQAHVLNMRISAELQAVETHLDSPGYAAAECSGEKVRHFQPYVVNAVASAAGET